MIIKGGSRAGPTQLAWHLQRRDTNEKVQILELQSPAENLKEAFRDWQTLSEGTHGFKGLYHAQINPAEDYVMTRDQWMRAVEVLEDELKFQGQDRAIVMHEKHGRQHIHVVWARTDLDRMILRSDSKNYEAHERASKRLELEFRHEQVPGKHAKRDRKKQPEFPRADANQAEWQEGERTGIHPSDRKDELTALRQACDTGQSFKTALEEHGYTLAKGDRGYVIVDEAGSIHALARQLRDMKAADLRAFMKDVPLDALPAAEEVAEQRRRHQEQLNATGPHEAKTDAKADKALPAEKTDAPPPREEPPRPDAEPTAQEGDKFAGQRPEAPKPGPSPEPVEIEALKKAVTERADEERRRLLETQSSELNELREAIARDTRQRLERFEATQREEAQALRRRQNEARSGLRGVIDSVWNFFSPSRAAEHEAERQREQQELARRQEQEREAYLARLEQANQLEVKNVTERHGLRLQQQAARAAEDFDRYVQEHEVARGLRADREEREREREREKERARQQRKEDEPLKDGPERPPPTRAR